MIAIECGDNVKIQAMRERLFRAVRDFGVGAPAPLLSCVCHLSHVRITGIIGGTVC